MIFNITDKQRKDNCSKFIQSLPEGNKWEVVIQERKNKRRLSQNRLMWMWIPLLADYFGYTNAQMHEELKYAFIGAEAWTNRKGVVRWRPISTTTLTVKEFAEYLNKIDIMAVKFDVELPHPDDYLFCMERE